MNKIHVSKIIALRKAGTVLKKFNLAIPREINKTFIRNFGKAFLKRRTFLMSKYPEERVFDILRKERDIILFNLTFPKRYENEFVLGIFNSKNKKEFLRKFDLTEKEANDSAKELYEHVKKNVEFVRAESRKIDREELSLEVLDTFMTAYAVIMGKIEIFIKS